MRKVRFLSSMPFGCVGAVFILDQYGSLNISFNGKEFFHITRLGVEKLIQDGWLEEVVEEKSLENKFRELCNGCKHEYGGVLVCSYKALPEKLVNIAMLHAVGVVEKAMGTYYRCDSCQRGLDALKKEAEG